MAKYEVQFTHQEVADSLDCPQWKLFKSKSKAVAWVVKKLGHASNDYRIANNGQFLDKNGSVVVRVSRWDHAIHHELEVLQGEIQDLKAALKERKS